MLVVVMMQHEISRGFIAFVSPPTAAVVSHCCVSSTQPVCC